MTTAPWAEYDKWGLYISYAILLNIYMMPCVRIGCRPRKYAVSFTGSTSSFSKKSVVIRRQVNV